ncbi:MAG: hypothetical protein ACREHD_10030 [Pirellulales bacterium]
MSQDSMPGVDQIDFIYSPEQPLTDEQRIEVLEFEVAELRAQLASLVERLGNRSMPFTAESAWE